MKINETGGTIRLNDIVDIFVFLGVVALAVLGSWLLII